MSLVTFNIYFYTTNYGYFMSAKNLCTIHGDNDNNACIVYVRDYKT